jgi:hypothetical protein
MKIFVPVCDDDLVDMKHVNPDTLVPYNQDYTSMHRLDEQRSEYTRDSNKTRRQS